MDDLGIRHGFYTTYNVTIFVRRSSDTNFEVSPPVLHSTASTEEGGKDGVSVRECFLYLAVRGCVQVGCTNASRLKAQAGGGRIRVDCYRLKPTSGTGYIYKG